MLMIKDLAMLNLPVANAAFGGWQQPGDLCHRPMLETSCLINRQTKP
jgi:hypothetical protein